MDEMVQLNLAILYDLFYQFLLIKFFFIEQREIFQVLNLIYKSFCIFVRLKSACYELFTNFIVEGLKKKKLYNNINVSIGKILGLIVKEESLSRHFFFSFHSIHWFWKNLDSQRYFKWFADETQRLLLFSNLLSSVFPSVFYHSVFSW